ncbi:MAG: ribonuclease J [Chloroflexi bacterium]|nr:ribonuclease J [Chloroflexota bacterium]
MSPRNNSNPQALRVIPLGGLGEIGKNMMILELAEDIVIIDAGVLFPAAEMMGVDVVIPNISYLVERAEKIRGLLITHGHEDHIGAVPYLLKELDVPIYAPPMAEALIRARLREHKLPAAPKINTIATGERLSLGDFEAEWFSVCHSIPDAMGIALDTPFGKIIHSGDFKIDHDPIVGNPSDFGALARIAGDGVFLLMADSTYAEEEGHSDSDRTIVDSLHRLIADAEGRVFLSSFASQIARIQIAVDSAEACGRKIAVLGRSMQNYIRIAQELGHLEVPGDQIVSPATANSLPDREVLFLTTGSQGEPRAALARLARMDHREVRIKPGDTVIISATPIPGNETAIYSAQDDLVKLGAKLIHHKSNAVHVHGHARREELRGLINLVRPQYFVPIHGEYRMLKTHAELAVDQGVDEHDAFVITDGDVLELDHDRGRVNGRIDAGHVFVDGLGLWDEQTNVIDERRMLSEDGIVNVIIPRNAVTGRIMGAPHITSAGFVSDKDAAKLFEDTVEELQKYLDRARTENLEWTQLEASVKGTVEKFLHKRTRRRPLVVPVAIDV